MAAHKTDLDRVTELARRQVAKLSESLGGAAFPVDLAKLAKQQKIGAVKFRPMLGSAGLLKTATGFDIVVNTEARGNTVSAGTRLDSDSSDWNVVTAPIRFTIAHEIAQALLVMVVGGDANKDLFTRHEQALDHLCNESASILLMPKRHVVEAVGSAIFDANHLVDVALKLRVSPEALMRRLGSTDILELVRDADGLVSLVSDRVIGTANSRPQISFVAGKIWGIRALNQFGLGPAKQKKLHQEGKFPAGRAISELNFEEDFENWIRAGERGEKSVRIVWRGGQPGNLIYCKLRYRRVSQDPFAAILTIEVVEGPLKTE